MIAHVLTKPLAKLLALANASRPSVFREDFYALKERLLERYARPGEEQVQHIEKECWGSYGDDYCRGEGCRSCGGTGIYSEFYVRLRLYEWHGHRFHIPGERSFGGTPPPDWPPVAIEGYIDKSQANRFTSDEARLWLYLLLGEWRHFWRELISHGYCTPPQGPYVMLALQTFVFQVRMGLPKRVRCYRCHRRFWDLARTCHGRPCRSCLRQREKEEAAWQAAWHQEEEQDIPF